MDYQTIYHKFVELCRSTSPRERLKKRNPADPRLAKDSIYTERHHIVLRADGGSDADDNLLTLLPEEHLFIHYLGYKAFNNRADYLAVRGVINRLRSTSKVDISPAVQRMTFNTYGLYRDDLYEFRLKSGWHTSDGIKRISIARKGTFPAKNILTGESVGSVSVDDPNVISGLYVHVTKGYMTAINVETGLKERITMETYRNGGYKPLVDVSGTSNPNYSGITDDEILTYAKKFYEEYNIVPTYFVLKKYCKKTLSVSLPAHLSQRFRFTNIGGYNNAIADALGEKPSYYNHKHRYDAIAKELSCE